MNCEGPGTPSIQCSSECHCRQHVSDRGSIIRASSLHQHIQEGGSLVVEFTVSPRAVPNESHSRDARQHELCGRCGG